MNAMVAHARVFIFAVAFVFFHMTTWADSITEGNARACIIVAEANLKPPAANRVLAIVHTAAYEAANAITKRYPTRGLNIEASPSASIDAAIAAAFHTTLARLVPSQSDVIETDYNVALSTIPDGPAKREGIEIGTRTAATVISMRGDDGAAMVESYKPRTAPGVYIPTALPAASQWPRRRPWLMSDPAQFRPGPPPDLKSAVWARDYNEIKTMGGKTSTTRSEEQTRIAIFWEATMPSIYHGLVASVADGAGRDVMQNARLYAAVTQAIDDALIAVFDAKYYYGFWRPITAIRNGDIDGNDATDPDSTWTPFIETPMHPEYPCAHCIVSGAVGTVLQAEIGTGPTPKLTTTSYTANGETRSWESIADFMQEVANARIYDGVHYRTSTEVGTAMGSKIGSLAIGRFFQPAE